MVHLRLTGGVVLVSGSEKQSMNDKDKKRMLKALTDALGLAPSQIDVHVINLDKDVRLPECLHTPAIFDLIKYMAYELAHDEDQFVDFWCSNVLAIHTIRKKSISDCHAWQTIVDDFNEDPPQDNNLIGRYDRLKRKLEEIKHRTAEHESED